MNLKNIKNAMQPKPDFEALLLFVLVTGAVAERQTDQMNGLKYKINK